MKHFSRFVCWCEQAYCSLKRQLLKKKTVAEEEEMSDSPQPPKLSPDQEAALESHFRRNKNVHASDVAILSAETGLDEEQVQVFFLFYFKKI